MISHLILTLLLPTLIFAKDIDPKKPKKMRTLPNVELSATYLKDNKNYIYMNTETETVKIRKKELTAEGVQQILANKEKELIIFIPEKSVVSRVPREIKEEEDSP